MSREEFAQLVHDWCALARDIKQAHEVAEARAYAAQAGWDSTQGRLDMALVRVAQLQDRVRELEEQARGVRGALAALPGQVAEAVIDILFPA